MKDNQEWSDRFDTLYNNITSNQSPGLDIYEKSVFLTKAQDDIIRAYFNPKENKVGEGFDDSEKRQVDFSKLIVTTNVNSISDTAKLDTHTNSRSIDLTKTVSKNPIFLILNEIVTITRNTNTVTCSVIPLKYSDYTRMLTKPNKRPPQYQVWRLMTNTGFNFDLIPPLAKDSISKYLIRYIKRPNPIVLSDLDTGLSINGATKSTECELDESLHEEILQRAVELAKATYQGDINTIIQVGNASGTDKGYMQQQQASR